MTDNEIIKALEHCRDNGCAGCPLEFLEDDNGCIAEVIALINRQKGEIEKREKGLQFLQETIGKNESRWLDIVAEQRAEAIKEFAERLHCHCQNIINEEWNKKTCPASWADAYEEFDEVVDNLIKEMVGEDNA